MFLVAVEFKRIQTFLFAASALRDMVGANVILGELIRRELPDLASKCQTCAVDILSYNIKRPDANDDDPLGCSSLDDEDRDDPASLYKKGILARDGGHFRVVFEDIGSANVFRTKAEALIANKAPGLQAAFHLEDLDKLDSKEPENGANQHSSDPLYRQQTEVVPHEVQILDSPLFCRCEATGTGPAVHRRDFSKTETENVSEAIFLRREAYKKVRQNRATHDVIGLLNRVGNINSKPAKDFHALCGKDYLAVIHADGNDIGRGAGQAAGESEPKDIRSFLQRESQMEAFFHANRSCFRIALVEALNKVFGTDSTPHYQLLMLGGDDLVMICRAKAALPFVVRFAEALYNVRPKLTIGVGVAMASPNVPFHHLHELAEELTGSAKRLYRRLDRDGDSASVVDWLVETGSWSTDPMGTRRKDLIRVSEEDDNREVLTLSRRPISILSASTKEADHRSLQGLLRAADAIGALVDLDNKEGDGKIARSQLRMLVEALGRGRRWTDFAFDGCPESLRTSLTDTPGIEMASVWENVGKGLWSTAFRDIVEIFEISRLATARAPSKESQ